VNAGGLEFPKSHEGVGFVRNGVFVVGVRKEGGPFAAKLCAYEFHGLVGCEVIFTVVGGILFRGESRVGVAGHEMFDLE
jgi:hypothetical protein